MDKTLTIKIQETPDGSLVTMNNDGMTTMESLGAVMYAKLQIELKIVRQPNNNLEETKD